MSQGPIAGDQPDEPGAVGLALLLSDTEAAIAASAGEIAMLSQVVVSGFGQLPKLLNVLPPATMPAPTPPNTAGPLPDLSSSPAPPAGAPSPVTPQPGATSPTASTPRVSAPVSPARPPTLPPVARPVSEPVTASAPPPAPVAPAAVSVVTPPGPSSTTPSAPPLVAPRQAVVPASAAPMSLPPALPASVAPNQSAPMPRLSTLPGSVAPDRSAPFIAARLQETPQIDYAAFAPLPPAPAASAQLPEIAPSKVPMATGPAAVPGPAPLAEPSLAPAASQAPATVNAPAAVTARAVAPSFAPPARRAETGSPPAQAGPTHGDVFLDGARVGRWMSDTLARAVSGPASGSTAFDPQMGAAWPGALQGG